MVLKVLCAPADFLGTGGGDGPSNQGDLTFESREKLPAKRRAALVYGGALKTCPGPCIRGGGLGLVGLG